MKKGKHFLTLFLLFLLCLTLSMPAYAAEKSPAENAHPGVTIEIPSDGLLAYTGWAGDNLSAQSVSQPESIRGLTAGQDYVSNEFVFLADSQEEAEQTATIYGGTLESYDMGVGVLTVEPEYYTAAVHVVDWLQDEAETDHATCFVNGEEIPALNVNYLNYADDLVKEFSPEEITASASTVNTDQINSTSVSSMSYDMDALWDDYYQWQHQTDHMDTAYAYNIGVRGQGIKVAVLDTGVQLTHPDLAANVLSSYAYDATGYGSQDDVGHGTHCAGIIAAPMNNIGVVGAAPEAKIIPVKVLYRNDKGAGAGTDAMLVRGINYANAVDTDIISLSLGKPQSNSTVETAINNAVNAGIVVIASAGNDGTSTRNYPAAYSNVIAVGSIDDTHSRSDFSQYGSWVDLAAPGGYWYNGDGDCLYVLSTYPTTLSSSGYVWMAGTSQACPQVAGAVADLLSACPNIRDTNTANCTAIVRPELKNSAISLPSSYQLGVGELDIGKLLYRISTVYLGGDGVDYGAVYNYTYYRQAMNNYFGNDVGAYLTHFVTYGMAEGRQGSVEFNLAVYKANYPGLVDVFGSDNAAYYRHYMNSGKAEGRNAQTLLVPSKPTTYNGTDYSDVYDPDFYDATYPGLLLILDNDYVNLLAHFVNSGMAEGRQGSAEFNLAIYQANYPALVDVYGGDNASYYLHYINSGKAEGRNASSLIVATKPTTYNGTDYSDIYDPDFYDETYPGLLDALGGSYDNLLAHFVNYGMAEGRQGSAEFNLAIYQANYPALVDVYGGDNASYYLHYINSGKAEGRNASSLIVATKPTTYNGTDYSDIYDPDFYDETYPGLLDALGGSYDNLLAHFVNYGMAEGRQGSAEFNLAVYKANYPGLVGVFGSDNASYYLHYINAGKAEGRNASSLI